MGSGTGEIAQAADGTGAAIADGAVRHAFEFRGNSAEYFRIWVVNLALTLLTLGIFSAWAKVRRERYFYGNTWVAGAPFEYLASPINVLKGRLIAFALLVAYVSASQVSLLTQYAVVLLVLVATPWILVSALRFRARYSAWSSIGFRFTGTLGDSFKYYLFMYVLLIPTLGLLYPYIRYRQRGFVIRGHRFGGHPFEFTAAPSEFYSIYLAGAGISIAASILASLLLVGVALAAAKVLPNSMLSSGLPAMFAGFATVGVIYSALFVSGCFVASRLTNLGYNLTRFGAVGFRSTIRARDLIWIYASNTVCILLTLGLLVPWAQVRLARYRAQHIELVGDDDLESFRAELNPERFAAGAETASVFDVDISL